MSRRVTSIARTEVPFLDLTHVNRRVRDRVLAGVSDLIDSGAFTNGPQVAALERAFADYCGTKHCVGVGSGLDALRLALIAAGVEAGDEVVVPANTFVATLEAVTQAGAVPVLVDVSERDYNLDIEAAESAISARTALLLPVHLYGQMADMRGLDHVARRHGARMVEDACQAHGAERDGLRAGAGGTAGAFSFYPAKNLGAIGDAGALVTDDAQLASAARSLREHGQSAKYEHDAEGYTARLDTIQALVLLHKLLYLDSWNREREAAARFYTDSLAGIGDLVVPPVPAGSLPVWHLYVVRTPRRDGLAEFLTDRGVATGRHYPQPAHLSRAYAWLNLRRGAFPVTEALADELLSLPLFPGISEEQLSAVVGAIVAFFRRG
jgi:dTDP-3-amino-3,4,6-trideoxy-alpha-D-glucose transaminase